MYLKNFRVAKQIFELAAFCLKNVKNGNLFSLSQTFINTLIQTQFYGLWNYQPLKPWNNVHYEQVQFILLNGLESLRKESTNIFLQLYFMTFKSASSQWELHMLILVGKIQEYQKFWATLCRNVMTNLWCYMKPCHILCKLCFKYSKQITVKK